MRKGIDQDIRPATDAMKELGRKNIVACEIGVLSGVNSRNIMLNLDVSTMYLIDPWCERRQKNFECAKEILEEWDDKLVWLQMNSEEVTLDDIPYQSLDFLYIDGDHSRDAVSRDLINYWPRMKKGGVIGGHDYNMQSVSDAVDAFFSPLRCTIHKEKARIGGGKHFMFIPDWWVFT